MLCHPNPKNVFIGGGGEGSTAREVLRHKSVEKCVMVDIDGDVVKFCRDHLPENTEAFNDPRLELIIDDAKGRMENSPIKFDIIIMDLDDPLEGGPCYQLYTTEFYETIKKVFPKVIPFNQAVYSFMDEWGWQLGLTDTSIVPDALSTEEVDKRIQTRINGELKFLDGVSWRGIWALSKKHRQTLAKETTVMSVKGNVHCFMHNPGVKTIAEQGDANGKGVKRPLPA